jgi:hypothetical protein
MQSIKHAFRFIGAGFSLALKHPQLQEPWFTLGIGSLILLIAWFLPMALVIGLLGLTPWGLALIGLLATLAWADLSLWGEITALLTSRAMIAIDGEPPTEAQPNLQLLKKHFGAVIQLALIAPVLWIGGLFRSKSPPINERNLWLKAHTLALPVIAIEDLPLKEALERLRQIGKQNLLPIRENFIRVRLVAGLVQLLLTAVGVFLAFWLGLKLGGPEVTNPWQQIMAVGIAMLVAWVPTFIGILFGNYTRICYATALYQWVQNVETARSTGNAETSQPPTILRQVLGSGRSALKDG